MQRRHNLAHCTLVGIVVLVLTPLMAVVDAQARIAFESDRDGHILNNFWAYEIYVMDDDGGNQRNITNNPQVTVVLHGLILLFRLLPQAKNSRRGVGSNRLTNNYHY